MSASCLPLSTHRVPDPLASAADDELRAHVERALAAHYELDCEIGRGGMGIVYRARDKRLKRQVAIKLLPPELAFRGDIRTRFMREAETAARLSHPNIVPIFAVDEREGMVFFVMGLVQGESVGDRVRRAGPLPIADARRILREVADALAYAHANGIVHRDIKPDNVLLDAASGRAMVTDFGIARAASSDGDSARLTATGAVIGTPAYMSPEQCAGDREIDGRSDLYSLGTVAYQMLTGEPPFATGNAPSIMMKQVTEPAVPVRQRRADVPEDLERIIMRLLAKQPSDRFADGAALVAALDGAPVTPVVDAAPRSSEPSALTMLRSSQTPLERATARGIAAAMHDFVPPHAQRQIELALSRREERELRRKEKRGEHLPLSQRLSKFRGRVVGYAGTSAFLFGINYVTMASPNPDSHVFWWAFFPFLGMGLGVIKEMGRLMGDGVPFGSLLTGSLPRELAAASIAPGTAAATIAAPALAADTNAEIRNGPYGAVLIQAIADRQTVTDLFSRLTDTERKMLPDVKETSDALFARVVALAGALHRLGAEVRDDRLSALDERIAQIERQSEASDRERRLALLRRQREMVAELVRSRTTLLEQYESAGLLLQNLALDLLKVRSSGLDSAINGLTSATQEARALSREIGYVLNAADELRKLEKS
jgi:serine/threonine protein kinase